jgi:hypothetical protein
MSIILAISAGLLGGAILAVIFKPWKTRRLAAGHADLVEGQIIRTQDGRFVVEVRGQTATKLHEARKAIAEVDRAFRRAEKEEAKHQRAADQAYVG